MFGWFDSSLYCLKNLFVKHVELSHISEFMVQNFLFGLQVKRSKRLILKTGIKVKVYRHKYCFVNWKYDSELVIKVLFSFNEIGFQYWNTNFILNTCKFCMYTILIDND